MLLRNGVIAVAATAVLLGTSGAALAGQGPAGDGEGKRGRHHHGVELRKPKSERDFPVSVPARSRADVDAGNAETSPPLGTQKIWPVIDFMAGDAAPES